jgi:hypothetical protein
MGNRIFSRDFTILRRNSLATIASAAAIGVYIFKYPFVMTSALYLQAARSSIRFI